MDWIKGIQDAVYYIKDNSIMKAFARVPGISPSSAKIEGAALKSLAPLKITLKLEGVEENEFPRNVK